MMGLITAMERTWLENDGCEGGEIDGRVMSDLAFRRSSGRSVGSNDRSQTTGHDGDGGTWPVEVIRRLKSPYPFRHSPRGSDSDDASDYERSSRRSSRSEAGDGRFASTVRFVDTDELISSGRRADSVTDDGPELTTEEDER